MGWKDRTKAVVGILLALFTVAGGLIGAYQMGCHNCSDQPGIEEGLTATLIEVTGLLQEQKALLRRSVARSTSEPEPKKAPTVAGGASDEPERAPRTYTLEVSNGLFQPIDDTGYVIGVKTIRHLPGSGYAALLAVTYRDKQGEAELSTGQTQIINGAAVTVVSVSADRAAVVFTV